MPHIFISYRRTDSAGYAGRLYDHLDQYLDAHSIFMDIDNIPPGEDFVQVIEKAVDQCDTMLVLIGPQWLTAATESGERRLDDSHDFVRLEISTALQRDIRVIPILVNQASMPRTDDLPTDLQPLTRRNAVSLSNERFREDVQRLMQALQRARAQAAITDIPDIEEIQKRKERAKAKAKRSPEVKPKHDFFKTHQKTWLWMVVGVIFWLALAFPFIEGISHILDTNWNKNLYERLFLFNTLFVIPILTIILAVYWPIRSFRGAFTTLLLHITNAALMIFWAAALT